MITVKELKKILKKFKDTDLVCIYGLDTGERWLPKEVDIDDNITGYFEINIDDSNNAEYI